MSIPPFFYGLYSLFYTKEESPYDFLASTFKKNMNLLKDCEEPQFLPPFWQIEEFFVNSFNVQNSPMTVKQYFKDGKKFLICLFSIYEILSQKVSFDCFVISKNFQFFISFLVK